MSRLAGCPQCWETAVETDPAGHKFGVCSACGHRVPVPPLDRTDVSAQEWNERHPAGTPVVVRTDDGGLWFTRTRSRAWMLGKSSRDPGHTPVVSLEGRAGGYALWRVLPRAGSAWHPGGGGAS